MKTHRYRWRVWGQWVGRQWWLFPVCLLTIFALAKVSKEVRWGEAVPLKKGEAANVQSQNVSSAAQESARIFYNLIETHPDDGVREDLNALLQAGQIIPVYTARRESRIQHLAAEVGYQSTEKGLTMTFHISTRDVLKNPEMSTAAKQLMIYHGWIHVKQLRDNRTPKWLPLLREEEMPVNKDGLRILFESEAEAYLEECHLAMRMQMPHELEFCEVYINQGLREMRLSLIRNYTLDLVFIPHLPLLTDIAMEHD